MYEVEVKVPADLEAVRSRLDDLEATPEGTVVQVDTYYDAPHRSFPETDEALRIRVETRSTDGEGESGDESGDGGVESEGERTRITYKGPLVDDESKTREEVETAVGDGEKMDAVLTNLGFAAAATVRKERERFALDQGERGYTITLDSVDDVGEYVEVETEVASDRGVETARDGAYDVLERLGLDPESQIRTSYLGLLLESRR